MVRATRRKRAGGSSIRSPASSRSRKRFSKTLRAWALRRSVICAPDETDRRTYSEEQNTEDTASASSVRIEDIFATASIPSIQLPFQIYSSAAIVGIL